MSKLAKAIAHPARIAILQLLTVNDCTCNEIVQQLPLAQSTVSQHLKELKKVNLIDGLEIPPRTIYVLNHEVYAKLQSVLNKFFNIS
ncbi:MAG: winged helix-turn-helix transcriptional regulator [Salinivirgaceae bacterium]|nr:winged helix-turn-helix transcriptional regulator [Salinivirgaceae bacterium]